MDSASTLNLVDNKNSLSSQSPTHQIIATATNATFVADTKGPINTIELNLSEAFSSSNLGENLLSVNQLDNQNYDTLFSKGEVYIGKDFVVPTKFNVKGTKKNGAYHVTLNKPIQFANRFQLLTNAQDNEAHISEEPIQNCGDQPVGTPEVSADSPQLVFGNLNINPSMPSASASVATSSTAARKDQAQDNEAHILENLN